MAKFSNAKIGDRVWSMIHKWGTVWGTVYTTYGDQYKIWAICIKFDNGNKVHYNAYGEKSYSVGKNNVELFWNEFHIPTEEEDKPPLDIAEFLQQNASCVEFKYGEENYYLCYEKDYKKLSYGYCIYTNCLGTVYLDSSNFKYIVEELNKNKITPQQVKDAYKQLNWI